MGQQHK